MDTIYGFLERIVFEGETFTVARLQEPRKKELTTVVGKLSNVRPGESLSCKGNWSHHPKHGSQFEVEHFESKAPSDTFAIQKYLESGLVKGIGPAYAMRIVEKFGKDTLKVIDEDPRRLKEVSGIGKSRLKSIIKCWEEQRSIREVMIFLRSYEVSPVYAQKIYRIYGSNAIARVKENPYSLAKDIFGIGFKVADRIAYSIGIEGNALIRLESGIEHTLWELSSDGHTCYPKPDLIDCAAKMLNVSHSDIEGAIATLVEKGTIVDTEGRIAIKPLHLYELGIARETQRLMHEPCTIRSVDVDKALDWAEETLRIKLAPEQKMGVAESLMKKMHILTGGPGTGKSTITRAILAISEKITGAIILAAPTGRAAKRMSEITRRKASTIHSLLEVDFATNGFKRGPDNPLTCSLLIVDEASMIDTKLMYSLLRAIPNNARVILIGDVDQLPSVGPGQVLNDMIDSGALPVTRLKKIFRQAAGSQIIVNAHRINQGEFPNLKPKKKSDFFFIEEEEPEQINAQIQELVCQRLPRKYGYDRFDKIQVLSPMKRGIIGCDNLNRQLQERLNPSDTPLFHGGRRFHLGDKVMQIRNNHKKEIYNGDIGRIAEIDHNGSQITINFDGRIIPYDTSELFEIQLAYAVSIHKYQGSECPCVVIPIHTSHFKLLFRNLLYTGITRGKELVVLIGTKKAIAMAIQNQEALTRHTALRQRLIPHQSAAL